MDSRLEESLGLGEVFPRFGTALVAVDPHEREIYGCLDPTDHALLVVLVLILTHGTEETSGVVSPPGKTGGHLSQASGDLGLERFPVGSDISTPGHRPVTLHASETAPGQDDRNAVRIIPAQAFINGLDDFKRIDIPVELPGDALIADPSADEVIVLRLSRILPPSIYPCW